MTEGEMEPVEGLEYVIKRSPNRHRFLKACLKVAMLLAFINIFAIPVTLYIWWAGHHPMSHEALALVTILSPLAVMLAIAQFLVYENTLRWLGYEIAPKENPKP